MSILAWLVVLAMCSQSVFSLNCFDCINVEVDPSSSSLVKSIFQGKSDSNCGVIPTSSNTVTCPSDYAYKCGSFNGEASVTAPFIGLIKVKTQILGCVKDSSPIGCSKDASKINELINVFLKIISSAGLSVTVNGDVCTCNWDMCVLCNGGVSLAGYCMKYWMLALVGGGTLLVFILFITCCCCCGCCGCCCCRKNQNGMVIQTNVPYRTLTTVEGVYTSTSGGVSVQSGDIVGYTRPVVYHGDQQYA